MPRAKKVEAVPAPVIDMEKPAHRDLRARNKEAIFLGSTGGQDAYLVSGQVYTVKDSRTLAKPGTTDSPLFWDWTWDIYGLAVSYAAAMNTVLSARLSPFRVDSIDMRTKHKVVLKSATPGITVTVDEKSSLELLGHPTESAAVRKWKEVEEMIEYGWKAKMYAILSGIPGTGKTTLADTTAKKVGVGHVPLTLDQDLYPDKLLGHFVPSGGQKWHFMHGPLTEAYVQGKIVSLNEINCAAGSVLTALYPVLDDRGVSRLVTPVQTHEPHDSFYAIATTNVPIKELAVPEALLDRFPLRIEINVPNPRAVQRLKNVAIRKLVWEVYSSGNPLYQKITFRQLKAVDALLQHGCSIGPATSHVLGDGAMAKEITSAINVGSSTK